MTGEVLNIHLIPALGFNFRHKFYFYGMKGAILFCSILFSVQLAAQSQIKWMTWEQAIAANTKVDKPIFVDVYTDWCGWCKRMDATTFMHPEIVKYMNEHYYSVKFNAERTDTIQFSGQTFVNEGGGRARSPHQLAIALLDSKMSYPSYAFIGNPWNKTVAPGYMGVADFERVIRYFVEGAPKGQTFEEFKSTFVSMIKQDQPAGQ